jgi:STE24 endopeptidase
MSEVFLYIILGVIVFDYLLERVLDYLNMTRMTGELPEELKGIYDPDRYKKSQQYLETKQRFSFVTSTVNFIAVLAVLMAGGFGWLDHILRGTVENPVVLALLFFGIIGIAVSVLSIPFELYGVFVIEERFGFNTTTVKTFVLDKVKGWVLGAVIGGGLLSLVVWIYERTGSWFWLLVWGLATAFMVFMAMFYSNLIVPLFNKQKPLEPGPLRDSIEAFAGKVGFRLKNIYVIDGSKRSKKANAYFTGLGSKKRIVLYDTLISNHTTEELVAVLAHEIGHYKKKHTTQGIIISILQTGLMLFILSFFIRPGNPLSAALCQSLAGFSGIAISAGFHLGILAFGMLYSPLSTLFGLFENMLSRSNEYSADRYAGENYEPASLQEALKKLSVNNLSNLRPHPAYVFFYYSHPTLLQRLAALEGINTSTR